MMTSYNNYINGKWVPASSGNTFDVTNPASQEKIAQVANSQECEAKQAVDAADDAFKNWSSLSANDRSEYLFAWAAEIENNIETLSHCITEEQGKPISESRGEIKYANDYVKWYAEESKRVYGEIIPSSFSNKRIFVTKQAIGVVSIITPWNFPAAMLTRKLGPALAAGCTVVIKPSEKAPITAIKLVELAEKAGIPAGVINLVTGDPRKIGETWLKDKRVRKISFTGSTDVGKHLMRESAATVKRLSLELGGHAPFIIHGDADLNKAVAGVIDSKFRNAGQTCICVNRVYVHQNIENEFLNKLISKVKDLNIGDGLDPKTDIGPLIDDLALRKVKQHLSDAKSKGAVVFHGGKEIILGKGHYFEPTILTNINSTMICTKEETFGPLAPVESFSDLDEVIEKANGTDYGLAAYVYSRDISTCFKTAESLDYGILGINDALPSAAQAPFGGMKQSGYGREGGHYGIEEYLEIKMVSLAL